MGGNIDFEPDDRFASNCAKWDTPARNFGADKLEYGMGVATMDFAAAPCITEALAERCEKFEQNHSSDTMYKQY